MTLDDGLHFVVQVYVSGEHVGPAWVNIAAFNHVAVAKNYAGMVAGPTRVIDSRSASIVHEARILGGV